MNGTEHPDPIDELLRRRVREGAPDGPDASTVDAELVELAPRFRRARQRRQAAVASVASAAAIALVVVGAFTLGGNGSQRIDTADDDRGVTSTSVAPSSTTTTSTTVPTTVPTTAPPTSTPDPSTAPTTAPGDGDAQLPIAPPTVPPQTSIAPPTTAPVGGTRTLTSEGGSATVRWTADSITVLSTSPAPGWSLDEVDQRSPTRVRIDFRRDDGGSGSSSSSIDARVVGGRLEVDS
jgi:hypothetical protein